MSTLSILEGCTRPRCPLSYGAVLRIADALPFLGLADFDRRQQGAADYYKYGHAEWLDVWIKSGHLHERGHHQGQFDDKGPYSCNNVKIITQTENLKGGLTGKDKKDLHNYCGPKTIEHRQNISKALKKTWKRKLRGG